MANMDEYAEGDGKEALDMEVKMVTKMVTKMRMEMARGR